MLKHSFFALLTLCVISTDVASMPVSGDLMTGPGNTELDHMNDEFEDDDFVSPVEVGPSGEIRRESAYRSAYENKQPVHFHFLWESRYLSQGRDNLSGQGLYSISTDITHQQFTFAPWLAISDEAFSFDANMASEKSRYREMNLNLAYGLVPINDLEIHIVYTFLRSEFLGDLASDHELAIESYFDWKNSLSFSATWVYADQAAGYYLQTALRYEELITSHVNHYVNLQLGANYGYIADGHKGIDHAELRTGLAWHGSDSLEWVAYIAYSHAIDAQQTLSSDRDLGLENTAHIGLGLSYRF